ncbi:hypothetical protein [Kitasatospora cinereorecta]|uniref:NAD(+)--protein-arginine ADP-ribosyltransferase n=1 Tax=Kitasatospora cinereorecta TaxID=285560 RepID=A0ABW0V626_9ACTN
MPHPAVPVIHLHLRVKLQPFRENLHPRDGQGRFAHTPGASTDPLLERIRAAAARPARAPRSQPRFDEEEHGLVFRDGDSERVAQAYKANVVAALTRDLNDIPDDALLTDHDRIRLANVHNGYARAHHDPETGQLRTTGPSSPPPHPSWTQVSPEKARDILRSEAVNRMVATWAMTSNDEDPAALALQATARDHFGLQPAADWPSVDHLAQATADHQATHRLALEAFLTAMWDRTQTHLAEANLGSLTVFRGMSTPDGQPPAGWAADGSTLSDPALRPLSAFSLNPDVAHGFATEEGPGIVMSAIVPAGRIIATPATGIGCLDEGEVVVLAGPGTWHWQRAD